MTSRTRRLLGLCAFATLALSSTACVPRGGYVEVDYAPRDVYTYPYVMYEGRPVYYVDGRWYYRHGPRWVYYSDPPPRLREYRYRVERAPRAEPDWRRREYERDRREGFRAREIEHARREDGRRREPERARRVEAPRRPEPARRREREREPAERVR